MGYSPILSSEVDVDSPVTAELFQKIKDNFDYLYSKIGEAVNITNGSFELDTDEDDIPDNWTRNLYAGGSGTYDLSTPAHGAKAYKFTRTLGSGNGGGYLESDYLECSSLCTYAIAFSIKSSVSNIKNIVKIRYFDKDKVYLSEEDVYSSTSNPTSWTRYHLQLTVPSGAEYFKVRLIGGYTDTDVAGDTYFDDVQIIRKVVQDMIKTSTALVSGYKPPGGGYVTITMADYSFFPNIAGSGNYGIFTYPAGHSNPDSTIGKFAIYGDNAYYYYVNYRYITSSEGFKAAVYEKEDKIHMLYKFDDAPTNYQNIFETIKADNNFDKYTIFENETELNEYVQSKGGVYNAQK